jgi:hypothetical protein
MKNTIRVHRNGDTQTASVQTKISRAKQPSAKTVTLIFYSPDDDKEKARVEFPEALLNQIQKCSRKLGITLDEFFYKAFSEEILRAAATTGQPSTATAKGGAK